MRSGPRCQLPFGSACRQRAALGSRIDKAAKTEHCLETSGVQEVFKVLMPLLTPAADGCAGIDVLRSCISTWAAWSPPHFNLPTSIMLFSRKVGRLPSVI